MADDLAVAIALGGDCLADLAVVRAQPELPASRGRLRPAPYIQAHVLAQRLERNWPLYVKLDLVDAEALSDQLREELTGHEGEKQVVVRRLTNRPARLDSQRLKLVKMAYADAIPLDLLKSEQNRVAREME
jgi:SpoVK/Ycf46/Vps4 family AAA+-type ATPase